MLMKPFRILVAILLFALSLPASAQLFSKTAKDMKKAQEFIDKKQYEETRCSITVKEKRTTRFSI
jgi:hypothetical protein